MIAHLVLLFAACDSSIQAPGDGFAVVSSVEITPSEAKVPTGGSLRLEAEMKDETGQSVQSEVEWTSLAPSVAMVDDSGRITGNATGTTSVVASSEGVSDTASLEVAPELVAGPEHPNEPAGYAAVNETGFGSLTEAGWSVNDNGDLDDISLEVDDFAPKSPVSVGRMEVQEGETSGTSTPGGHVSPGLGSSTEVYIHFWLKLDSNFWTDTKKCMTKLFFFTGPAGNAGTPVFATVRGCGVSDPQEFEVNIQNPDGSVSARNLSSNAGDGLFSLGDWHEFEMLFRANTGGNSDGELHVWIDGVKHHEYRDVRYFGEVQNHTWNNFRWVINWGPPDGSSAAPHDYGMNYDHVYISAP